jgi:hypothetical protein
MPETFEFLKGMFLRTKAYRRFMKLQKRGVKKLRHDLDILNVFKQNSLNKVQLFSLMTDA